MMQNFYLTTAFALLTVLAANCSKSDDSKDPPWSPNVDPSNFVTEFTNPYFPVVPGRTMVYVGESDGETDSIEVFASHNTRTVMGVVCAVVEFREWVNGELVEVAYDWYAQDNQGTVWYFGEAVENYEGGVLIDDDGSWEAGVDDARPGYVMLANPTVGDEYYQEYYEEEAEDQGRVISLDDTVTVPYGTFTDVVTTEDWTALEPGVLEHKYYARGLGEIKSEHVGSGSGEELVAIRME